MPIFELVAGQGRTKIRCLWFNASYLQDRFKPGQLIALYGKVEQDLRTRELQLVQPQFEILDEGLNGTSDAAEETLLPRWKWGESYPFMRLRDRGV